MPNTVSVVGAPEVRAGFGALARDVADLTETNRKVAELVVPGASRRSPRATGALAASWRATASKVAAGVVSGVPYAGPVEYGVPARGIAGRRMVADTIAAEADAIVDTYAAGIKERGRRRGFDAAG